MNRIIRFVNRPAKRIRPALIDLTEPNDTLRITSLFALCILTANLNSVTPRQKGRPKVRAKSAQLRTGAVSQTQTASPTFLRARMLLRPSLRSERTFM